MVFAHGGSRQKVAKQGSANVESKGFEGHHGQFSWTEWRDADFHGAQWQDLPTTTSDVFAAKHYKCV